MKTHKRKGQLGIETLPTSVLYLGIAVVVVVLVLTVLTGLQTSQCTSAGGTEVSAYDNSTSTNPTTSNYNGCCLTTNTTDSAGNCTSWASGAEFNATEQGVTGLATFNNFWAVLVLIVILAIVITALYKVMPKTAGY